MPYVNDPSEKALLPTILVPEEDLLEEPRDYHEFFGDDLPAQIVEPKFAGSPYQPYTQVCRFNEDGEHTAMAYNCPHFDMEDETGRRIVDGWTVQQ